MNPLHKVQINISEIEREKFFTDTISKRDALILILFESNGELQKKLEIAEKQIKTLKNKVQNKK